MIILFGPAGSGKGTQGQILAELFGWRWLSVGEVIRASHRYDAIISQGKLIPDRDVIRMMQAEIGKSLTAGQDLILDGYPRDEIQAGYVAKHYGRQIHGAIVLEVPREELYQRLALRGRADDQDRAVIDQRFDVFEQNICSILKLLGTQNIPVRRVDGTGAVEAVTRRLVHTIYELNPALSPTPTPRKPRSPLNSPIPGEPHPSLDSSTPSHNSNPKESHD